MKTNKQDSAVQPVLDPVLKFIQPDRLDYCPKYKEVMNDAKEAKDNKYCGPVSLAIATGVSYKESAEACAKAGRPFKKGMSVAELGKAAEVLGYTLVELEDYSTKVRDQVRIQYNYWTKNVTTKHLKKFPCVDYVQDNPNQIWHVSGHFVAVINGKVEDFSHSKSLRLIKTFAVKKVEEVKQAVAKKVAAKKPVAKKPVAKKPVAKKPAVKKG